MGDGSPTRVASSPGFVQSLSNPKYVKKVLNIRVCKYLGCSIGQSVDKCWIFLSNLCPKPINLDRISTSVRQRLDRPCTIFTIGQTLDRIQTDIGQRLDFMSKVCPTAVQPPIVKEDRKSMGLCFARGLCNVSDQNVIVRLWHRIKIWQPFQPDFTSTLALRA